MTASTHPSPSLSAASLSAERTRASALVAQMSVEEKALLLSGDGPWRTHAIERLDIPAIALSDGPHGLRKLSEMGAGQGEPATCFPTAPGMAATWNVDLIQEVGAALGREAQSNDVQILLGPGVNMKRSPLGGRNFEYFAEDPLLAGELAIAYIKGVQGEGVGTSLKHYAVNNQEFERMSTSSNLDERTLHEIYLPAFEMAVTQAQPWTVMSAYNLVNGIFATEHTELLTDILRETWGFEGFVVSDWGAIHDRVQGVAAGTDLEMPGSGDYNRKKIIAAVEEGRLSVAALDRAVVNVLSVVLKAWASRKPGTTFDADAHHALARRAAGEGIVLLKNEDDILPLKAAKKIAIIGQFAKYPRYQGAGSSQVNPTKVSNAYDELAALLGDGVTLSYAPGYVGEGETGESETGEGKTGEGETTDDLIAAACVMAEEADVALIFAGLPDSYESEGFDRAGLDLPAGHNRLIKMVSETQPNLAVVLMNGSAVAMPWVDDVKGIVEGWLGGQAGGGAIADVLTGAVNPSGKLAETFPVSLEQSPTYPNFPAHDGEAIYGEGLFVGYRYYDKKKLDPLFPFGFGLSYTSFAYTGIEVETPHFDADGGDALTIHVRVKNTGNMAGEEVAGKEIVQLYVHEQNPCVVRPERVLRAFAKVDLAPGQETTVPFTLTRRDFAYYSAGTHTWEVNPGLFDILVGGSSRDLPLAVTVEVQAKTPDAEPLTRYAMIKDLYEHPSRRKFYEELLTSFGFAHLLTPLDEAELADLTPDEIADRRKARLGELVFVHDMPLYKLPAFSRGHITDARLEELLEAVAAAES